MNTHIEGQRMADTEIAAPATKLATAWIVTWFAKWTAISQELGFSSLQEFAKRLIQKLKNESSHP